jgi:wee1-like protein kinase
MSLTSSFDAAEDPNSPLGGERFCDNEDAVMAMDASIESPPRHQRKERFSFAPTPKARLLFDDDELDTTAPESPPTVKTYNVRRHPKPLDALDSNHSRCTSLDDSNDSTLSSCSNGSTQGRKRSSVDRQLLPHQRTPVRSGTMMMDGSCSANTTANGTAGLDSSMYASPRISPNSFLTMDGRFVHSKNPFSSPMMTDTPPINSGVAVGYPYTQDTIGQAPSIPFESFYSHHPAHQNNNRDENSDAKVPASALPPRNTSGRHVPYLQPKTPGTPASQAAAGFHACSISSTGYPVGRFSFTGSPIPEQQTSENSNGESNNVASAGSLHKVRRINMTDDVVSASGHHLTLRRVTNHPPTIRTKGPMMNDLDGDFDDRISPNDVMHFPVAPPTPVKQRPSISLPYSSIRRGQPPMLRRKGTGYMPRERDEDDANCNATNSTNSRFHQDFDVIGELGKGSFGTVYKVLSRLDGCMYAIKAAQRQAKGAADRDRMLKEVYALAALSDQADTANFHIVRYHQAWMEDDRLYIQTELCSGTLTDEMNRERGVLSTDRRYKLLREMLLALEFIHRNNMVHLDIKVRMLLDLERKSSGRFCSQPLQCRYAVANSFSFYRIYIQPENIFLKNDQYKLGDFGLVTKLSASHDVEEGDSRYMSMELLSGDRTDLTKSDIFSLGSAMYEICLGRPLPMNGQEWQDLRSGKLSPLPNTDDALANIIQRMMSPVASNRPTPAALLKHPMLLSDEQKALNAEKNKVIDATLRLVAAENRGYGGGVGVQKRQLTRANTWSGGSLPFL